MKKPILALIAIALFAALPLHAQTDTPKPTSQLSTATAIDAADLMKFVDVSDTTASANGTDKKILFGNLKTSLSLQPLDEDLTAIAAITTTSFGRSFLGLADALAVRTLIGAGTGSGDALTANPLSQFAATTSAQLAAVLSNETGSGAAVFGTSPTIATPTINVGSDATGDLYFRNAGGLFSRLAIGSAGQVLKVASGIPSWGTDETASGSGGGTVTSVGLTAPSGFTVTGSPVTSSGTLAISTTLSGIVKGTGTGFAAATAGSDFLAPTGDGSGLTALSGSAIASGTVAEARIDATIARDAEVSTAYQTKDADLTTWAGITPASGVGTFLGTPSSANLATALSDETGSGAAVFGTSPTIATPTISGAFTLGDDVRQIFNPGATNAGLNVGAIAGDPSTPTNGDLWYDSTANELTARINGANVALGAGGGGGTPGGSSGQLQYNDAGAFSGTAAITTNGAYIRATSSSGGFQTNTSQGMRDSGFGDLLFDTQGGTWNLGSFGNSLNNMADDAGNIGSPTRNLQAGHFSRYIELRANASPGTPTANTARIYAKAVSASAEMFVKDEAGNETQISPHANDAPASLYDADEPFPQVTREANDYLGIVRYVNVTRKREGRSGWEHRETYAEHNARLGLTGAEALVVLDWDAVQSAHVAKREQERSEWATRKSTAEAAGRTFTEPEPPVYTAKPKPTFLVDAEARKALWSTRRTGKEERRNAAYLDLKNDVETLLGITISGPEDLEAKAGELLALANQKRAEIDAQGTTLAATRQALALERKITNLFFRFTVFLARR